MDRSHVRNDEVTIRIEQTGMVVIALISAPLAGSIDATSSGDLTLIGTARNSPFTSKSFGT